LPDLQARIQVALFNILQEGDIQIRGFKIRMLLDIQFVFTANPEDYTNRGSIVTPLKDRIDSQIITHYPKTLEIGKHITQQEARLKAEQRRLVSVNEIAKDLIEQIAFEARKSEFVDSKSGVSARLTISAYENLVAAAERRSILNHEKNAQIRILDFVGVIPAITGKVELVYEGEQEGPGIVAQNLVGKALRTQFITYFPDPDKFRKQKEKSPYKKISNWFGEGNTVDLLHDMKQVDFEKQLHAIPGLRELVKEFHANQDTSTTLFFMEFALHGLAEFSLISKHSLTAGLQFKDLLSSMFTLPKPDEDDEDDEIMGRRKF
jgi:magnesium chelatase subunit I